MKIHIHKVMSNTAWLTVGQISLRTSKIVLISIAVSVLGLGNYGIISIILAFISVFYIPASLVHTLAPVVRDMSTEDDFDDKKISINFSWRIILAVASLVLGFVGVFFYNYNPLIFILLGSSLFFDYLKDFFNALIESRSDMKLSGGVFIVHALANIILGFVLLRVYKTVESLAVVYAITSFLALLLSIIFLKKYNFHLASLRFSVPKIEYIKNFLREGFGFSLFWVLLTNFAFQILIVCLSFLTTSEEVAVFSIVFQIIQALLIPYIMFSYSNIPPLSKIFGKADFIKRFTKFIVFPFFTILPYTALATLFVFTALPFFFKDNYQIIEKYFISMGISSVVVLSLLTCLSYALIITGFFKKKPYLLGGINASLLFILLVVLFLFGKNIIFVGLPVFYILSFIIIWKKVSTEVDMSFIYLVFKKDIWFLPIIFILSILSYNSGLVYVAFLLPVVYFSLRAKTYYLFLK